MSDALVPRRGVGGLRPLLSTTRWQYPREHRAVSLTYAARENLKLRVSVILYEYYDGPLSETGPFSCALRISRFPLTQLLQN